MIEIASKKWDYLLYEDKEKFYLSVICGSVALYEIHLILNENETQSFLSQGITYVENLVKEIQFSPSSYSNRSIEGPVVDI